MKKAPHRAFRCLVCLRLKPNGRWGLCRLCQRSFDLATGKEHTIMGVIVWAARRARRAARSNP